MNIFESMLAVGSALYSSHKCYDMFYNLFAIRMQYPRLGRRNNCVANSLVRFTEVRFDVSKIQDSK